ncbi:MAG: hypothetical protein QNK24_14320 [Desulfuromusa sp.]|nr:hypothetical protein [Desulfuromusa sp.]
MYLPKLRFRMFCTMLLVLFPVPLVAQDDAQLNWIETKDQWGQVLFCQAIYKMPEVKTRLYGFDVEQCDKAGQLMMDVTAKYSKQDQEQMKTQAEQHAYLLSRNTSEPYHSVIACREYCRELIENQGSNRE